MVLGVRSPGTGPWGTHGSLSAQWQVGTQQGSASPSQVCVCGGVGVLAGAHASSKQGPVPRARVQRSRGLLVLGPWR